MRIGIVTRSQVDYAIDLANGFIAEGQDVSLYLDHAETVEEVGSSAPPLEILYSAAILPKTCKVNLLALPRMRDVRSIQVLRNLRHTLQDEHVQVMHILLNPGEIWLAVLASLVSDVAVVTTMIVPVANAGERLPSRLVWARNKLAALGSDIVIVNAADQVELVKRRYGIANSRVAHVPLSMHARSARWDSGEVREDPDTILFFGRAHPQKGLEYLVKAQPLITQRIPAARILISAHGEDLQRCRQMILDPSKFEITEGVVAAEVMAALFRRAALVVLPYITASTSGVLVTAYSYGKPVVASRVGALAEYVEEGVTGLLVPPCDVEQLAGAIVRLLRDDALRLQMGRNGLHWSREMQKVAVQQTLAVYQRAIGLHARGKVANAA